jgi:branched-chain amino acid aminotransferase
MQNATLNVNGKCISTVPTAQWTGVSPWDRGFLYGDSLYEVLRTYEGKLVWEEEHLERLEQSARLCHFRLDFSRDFFKAELRKTVAAFYSSLDSPAKPELVVRLVVSRGAGSLGFDLSHIQTPNQWIIYVYPLVPASVEQLRQGVSLRVVSRLRNAKAALDPAMKSGNYLNSLLAYLEAKQNQAEGTAFFDALLCDAQGFLTEGTTFNVFYIRRGILATPPLGIGILPGITRQKVLSLAQGLGLLVREVRFTPEYLQAADEVFLTSTIREVLPVTQVDSCRIQNGRPGPWTQRLLRAYHELCVQPSSHAIGKGV